MMAEYIEREATIKAIVDSRNRYYNSASSQYLVGRCDGLDIAAGLLRVAPAADVAPVVQVSGKVRATEEAETTQIIDGCCTACGAFMDCIEAAEYKFCPYCGKRIV
jgi:hypothetical protein